MERTGPALLLKGFEDEEMERRFIESLHDPRELRIIAALGTVMYLAFLPLDHRLFPEFFARLLFLRCGVLLPAAGFVIASSFTRFYKDHSRSIIAFFALTAAGGIILMEYIVRSNPYAGLYFYGVSLVIIFFYGTGKISTLFSMLLGILIVAPSLIVDAVFVETDPDRILTKGIYLVSMFLAGLTTSGIIQGKARANFLYQEEIKRLSMTDALTGLKNRLFFNTFAKKDLERCLKTREHMTSAERTRRSDGEGRSCKLLILLDIDYFKKINDEYGHEAGDLFLKEFGKRIHGIIRPEDVLIRWGGEEFLLVVDRPGKKAAADFCARIRESVSGVPFTYERRELTMTVSGGVLVLDRKIRERFDSVDPLIVLADKALYHSKRSGRDRFTETVMNDGDGDGPRTFMNPLP